MKFLVTLKVMGMKLYRNAVMCNDLSEIIKGETLPLELKRAVQTEISQQLPDSEKINVHSKWWMF